MRLAWKQDGLEWSATYRHHSIKMYNLSTGWTGYVDGKLIADDQDEAALEERLIEHADWLDRPPIG